jgi:hypothetical protein
MAQRDLEFLSYDKELGSVRKAERNLRHISAEAGPQVRAYIKALKTLNAEISRRLELFQGRTGTPGKARRSLHKTRTPRVYPTGDAAFASVTSPPPC